MSDWVAPLSAEPLFLQLKRSIAQHLRESNYRPGDRIPSENDFCAYSAVSIRTVRRALAELERDGILQRIRGRGTFLQRPLSESESTAVAQVIGITFSDSRFMTRPVFLELLQAMEEEIAQQGYHYHLYATGQRESASSKPLSAFLPQDLPQLVIATSALNSADINFLRAHGVALCAFNLYRKMRVNSVRFDFAAAARIGLDYLLARNCRRLMFLGEHFNTAKSAVVYGNYLFQETILQEARKRNLATEDLLFLTVSQDSAGGSGAIAALSAEQLLPDAVFALSPQVAQGALLAARERTLPISEWLCCYDSADPAIASLRVPVAEMGRTAVQFGLKSLTGGPGRNYQKAFLPELVPSFGPAARLTTRP